MHKFTLAGLKIITMPKIINVLGRGVDSSVFFSSALCEPLLQWQASALSNQLHGETLFDLEIVAARTHTLGLRMRNFNDDIFISETRNISAASGVMLIAAAIDSIVAPTMKHPSFDYGDIILGLKEIVFSCYEDGDVIRHDDPMITAFCYENITKPAIAMTYAGPTLRNTNPKGW
jgi:hypothetical protein